MATPKDQALNIVVTNITPDSCSISCTPGDGEFRTIWVGEGSTGDLAGRLTDGMTYLASDAFNVGDQVSGFSCVFNGPDYAVDVSNLSISQGQTFRVVVCEHNGGAGNEEYNDDPALGNPVNFTTIQGSSLMMRRHRERRRAR